ncbi:MAG: hypothetical protein U1F36_20235 [Planctomycetota bacterium]
MQSTITTPACAILALIAAAHAQSGWSAPQVVPNIASTVSDTSPTLSADGLTMWFASSRSGGAEWEIYETTRASTAQPFGTPVLSGVSMVGATDTDPFVSHDGLELYFCSTRAGGQGNFDILRATRPSTAAPFGPPAFVTELNSPDNDGSPSLTADGLTIYILSARAGSPNPPNAVIWRAKRPNRGSPFSTPVLVGELANADANRGPEVAPDDLSIVWMHFDSTTRDSQLVVASRTSTAIPFGVPVVVPELSGPGRIDGPTFDATRSVMYLPKFNSAVALGFVIHETRFLGLVATGVAGIGSTMTMTWRDSAHPGSVCIGAFSLGNGPTTILGRVIPLDLDWLFTTSLGGVPPMTGGYVAALDPAGETHPTLTSNLPALVGLHVFTGFFTLDSAAPLGVATIGNSIEIEFH